MKNCKEIYLIGPGKSKLDYDPTQLKNKVTLNFSGDLMWFNDNNIFPTYWTFFDPNSTLYIFDRYKNNKYNLEVTEKQVIVHSRAPTKPTTVTYPTPHPNNIQNLPYPIALDDASWCE